MTHKRSKSTTAFDSTSSDGAPVLRRSSRIALRGRPSSHFVSFDKVANEVTPDASDKPSVALKIGLQGPQQSHHYKLPETGYQTSNKDSELSGCWSVLPEELIEMVLKLCSPTQLGMLQTTCSYFHQSKLVEKIAKQKLRSVPRARGMRPNKKEGESYTMMLHFVTCQSAAAAQATSVACGSYHTAALLVPCALADDQANPNVVRHHLFAFGRGFHGQLGATDYSSRKAPARVSLGFRSCQDNNELEEETMPAVVACGAHHSTSISRRGELFSWGLGTSGELGLGRWGPIELSLPRQCSLPHVRIVSVACGANHTLAIGETGSLWSCGSNKFGQLGVGTQFDGGRLQAVHNLGSYRIVSAAAGVGHSLALASDGSLFTWGDGTYGQLGHSQLQSLAAVMAADQPIIIPAPQKVMRLDPAALSPESRVTAIAAGAYHSMAVTVGGTILAFGRNDHGQLGTGDQQAHWKPTKISLDNHGKDSCSRAVQLACGFGHTVALISTFHGLEVRTTGLNNWGQLGLGDRIQRLVFTPVAKLPNMVVAVQAGNEHTAAITVAGELFMWGRGDSGQLGLGDGKSRSKPTLLKNYTVVHPDKTLRRNKRNQPYVRSTASTAPAKKGQGDELAIVVM